MRSTALKKFVTIFSNVKHNRATATTCEIYLNNTSQTEATIQAEVSKKRPMVKCRDGRMYPKKATNGYVSQYADGCFIA